MNWTCVVHGPPVGKGRPRFARAGGFVRTYTPAKTARWEDGAAQVMASRWHGAPLDCPVGLLVVAVVARPKNLRRKKDPPQRIPCTTRPDFDNYAKAAADALQRAGVVRDDAVIWSGTARKFYAALDEGPRVEVELTW